MEYRSIVAVGEALHGAGVRQTASAKNGLAIVVHQRGDLAEAERLFREAIAVVAPDEVEALTVRVNLANVLIDRGDLAAAEVELRSAVTAGAAQRGKDHPDTVTSRYNLAQVLRAQGNLGEAERLVREVLDVRRRLFSDDHPSVLVAWHGLCLALEDKGEQVESEYRNLARVSVRVLGPKHPHTLTVLNSLAILLRANREFLESEAIFRGVLSGVEGVHGPRDARSIGTRLNLGTVLQLRGDVEAAMAEYRAVLDLVGDTDPLRTQATLGLATGLHAIGRSEEAAALIRGLGGR